MTVHGLFCCPDLPFCWVLLPNTKYPTSCPFLWYVLHARVHQHAIFQILHLLFISFISPSSRSSIPFVPPANSNALCMHASLKRKQTFPRFCIQPLPPTQPVPTSHRCTLCCAVPFPATSARNHRQTFIYLGAHLPDPNAGPPCPPSRASSLPHRSSHSITFDLAAHTQLPPVLVYLDKPPSGAKSNPNPPPPHMERRCVNCHTSSTPLWRRSPLGPKTLCNACGVRMKKGRLAFVDGRFVQVESAAAIAKRRKAEAAAKTARENAANGVVTPPSLPKLHTPIAKNRSAASRNSAPSKNAANPSRRNLSSSTSSASSSRPFAGSATGLYYLLAAIDFVEAS